MTLPISAAAKSALWIVLFGLAKTAQYCGLAILGVEGWRRVKRWFKSNKQ
jgi:phosphoglycolate phosphatase